MSDISPKERLFRRLSKKGADRLPVICPGGMMSATLVDILKKTGHSLPEGHSDSKLMAQIARDVSEGTGFENYGAPFCMTVEAEALGSSIDFGSLSCEPKIKEERYKSVADINFSFPSPAGLGRVDVVANAIHELSGGDIPVIGSVTGPISAAASLVDPMTFLKQLRKDPTNAHRLVDQVTDWLIEYAQILIESGADVISIADPTATGEILGPKMFKEYALRYLNKLADAGHKAGRPVIIHICGKLEAVSDLAATLHSDALSADAMVSLKALKQNHGITTMGNLSTFMLQDSTPALIARATEALINGGTDIAAPACGLSTSTPQENINAFTSCVKEAGK
ncbi:MAG: methylcobamide--CoM methyltransferase [Clostridiales bacterium]|jgi:[methyl-Co(III) methanol-specific corrinoid protein]:coenzyme M methyltransferase|nr:methylcobamide--CoM methyltransferase [Clostridiales bacterium]